MSKPVDASTPSLYVFELENDAEAIRIAKEIADKSGRTVTVHDAQGVKIETITPVLQ